MTTPMPIEEPGGRSWPVRVVVPLLAALVALVAVLGYLVLRGDEDDGGSSTSPATTAGASSTRASSTSASPTTAAEPGVPASAVLSVEADGWFPWLFPTPSLSWYEEGCPRPEVVLVDFMGNVMNEFDALFEPVGSSDPHRLSFAVQARGENGQATDTTTTVTLARVDPGVVDCEAWGVLSAQSPDHAVLTTPPGTVVGATVTVSGEGSGFESTVGVALVDETYEPIARVGQFDSARTTEAAPFQVQITLTRAPIDANLFALASSDWAADGAIAPFAAVKLRYDGSPVDAAPADLPDPIGPVAVVGVAADDELNARTAAGVDNDVLGAISPFEVGMTRYDVDEQVDGATWTLVGNPESRDFDAWVNASFLTFVQGDAAQPAALYDQVSAVREALTLNAPTERLADAGVVGADGLTVSADGFFGDTDQVLTVDDLFSVGTADDTVRTWGFEDGTGDPIDATIEGFFDGYAETDALARTELVAVNERLRFGNTIDNAAEFFPDATVVELHYTGDPGDLVDFTWQTLRLVFRPNPAGAIELVGIALDGWTI